MNQGLTKPAAELLVSDINEDGTISAPKGMSPRDAMSAFDELKKEGLIQFNGSGFELTPEGVDYRNDVVILRQNEVGTLPPGTPWSGKFKLMAYQTPQVTDGSCGVFDQERKICFISYFDIESTQAICNLLNDWPEVSENLKHVVPGPIYAQMYNRAVASDKHLAKAAKLLMELCINRPPVDPLNMKAKALVEKIFSLANENPLQTKNNASSSDQSLSVVHRDVPTKK